MRILGAIVSDYKSIGTVEIPLTGLTVLLGPNGSGKTNLIEAIGYHDPVARAALRRGEGTARGKARLGLVVVFDVSADDETLRQMLAWPWEQKLDPLDITEGIGAYCGSAWWLYGGNLYDDDARKTLTDCFTVVRRSLTAEVPPSAAEDANRLIDLLFADPILIVQEDFKVELSCDRQTDAGRQITALADRIRPHLGRGALSDLVGALGSWTGRWPPLTAFTRGPDAGDTAGFSWIASEMGGVRVINGDPVAVEQYLDSVVEVVHDRMVHISSDDLECEECLHPDHGGRVDPAEYKDFDYAGSSDWLEENDEWVRVRSGLLGALAVVEDEANRRLIPFIAAQARCGSASGRCRSGTRRRAVAASPSNIRTDPSGR